MVNFDELCHRKHFRWAGHVARLPSWQPNSLTYAVLTWRDADYLNTCDDFIINPGQENFAKVSELGSSSIDITILCYLEVIGYTEFSQVKQDLILRIMEIVSENGSDFAFPSRSIYIENQDA